MPRAAGTLCAILLAVLLTPARAAPSAHARGAPSAHAGGAPSAHAGGAPSAHDGVAATVTARAAASTPAAAAAPRLPPDLAALVKKMEGLTVSSERFRVRTAISGAQLPREAQSFLKLFDAQLSGEATISPPAGSFALTFFGHTLRVRVVHEVTYLYEPAIARRDRGRPWVEVGRDALGRMLAGSGDPSLAAGGVASSFRGLAVVLATGIRGITELGPGIIDGQAITGFRARVASSALEEPAVPAKPPSILRKIFPRHVRARSASGAAAPPSEQLEVFIAASGLPVRMRITAGSEGITTGTLVDMLAIDFPLRVEPPPRDETITEGGLRRLARRHLKRPSPEAREDA